MAESKSKDSWNHTASLMALLANAHRDKKRKSSPYKPSDFNPFSGSRKRQRVSVEQLTREMMAMTRARTRPKRRPADKRPEAERG